MLATKCVREENRARKDLAALADGSWPFPILLVRCDILDGIYYMSGEKYRWGLAEGVAAAANNRCERRRR